ncbi:MAG: hypothetical protein ACRDP4_14055 [Nocardioidaceae bacterium]
MSITLDQWQTQKDHIEAAKSGGARVLSNMSLVSDAWDAFKPEPDQPPASPLVVGATAHRYQEDKIVSTRWANDLIGPLGATRIFERDLPATWVPLCPDLPDMQEIISYKSATQANIESYVASMRPGDLLCYFHEPENDFGGVGADFVAAWTAQQEMVGSAGGELGMIAMSYQYAGGRNGQDGSFLPPADLCAWYGVDDYEGGAAKGDYGHIAPLSEDDGQFNNWYQLVKALGRPLLITEYGRGTRDREPYATQQRLDVIPQDEQWLIDNGFSHWLYWFEDGQGGIPGSGGQWIFDDQASIDLWASLSEKYAG